MRVFMFVIAFQLILPRFDAKIFLPRALLLLLPSAVSRFLLRLSLICLLLICRHAGRLYAEADAGAFAASAAAAFRFSRCCFSPARAAFIALICFIRYILMRDMLCLFPLFLRALRFAHMPR